MKKLLALILALLIISTVFVGCGAKSDDKANNSSQTEQIILTNENIAGDWIMEMDINKYFKTTEKSSLVNSQTQDATASALSVLEMFKGMDLSPLKVKVTFKTDGEIKIDANSFVDAFCNLIDDMLDWMAKDDNLYTFLESSQELTREQIDQMFQQSGITKQQYIDAIKTQFDAVKDTMSESVGQLEESMGTIKYLVDGNKIYTWDATATQQEGSAFSYEYDGKAITVTEITDNGTSVKLEAGTICFKK